MHGHPSKVTKVTASRSPLVPGDREGAVMTEEKVTKVTGSSNSRRNVNRVNFNGRIAA